VISAVLTHARRALHLYRTCRPDGHLIAGYRAQIKATCIRLVSAARAAALPATLSWAVGSCRLAFNRNLVSPEDGSVVVGLNPAQKADDTLLVGRVADAAGKFVQLSLTMPAHPTSLGGANQLISPDYVGAMRETVEQGMRRPVRLPAWCFGRFDSAAQLRSRRGHC